jgi:Ca2+-binding EF-hand superfamily protein
MILFLVFEESFSLLDKDGDGNISNYEIRSLMNSLGYTPSEEDISSVIAKVDIDGKLSPHIIQTYKFEFLLGDGSVDFDEFLTMMRRRKSTGEYDTELLQVFNVKIIFDKY